MEVVNLKLSQIKNATENYRLSDSEIDVSGLMQSIKKVGLVNPITVKRKGKNFELVAGFRRFNAVKKLKIETIPANIIENDISSTAVNLVENIQRENTSSYEIGRGIFNTMRKDKMSTAEVGVLLGMSKKSVQAYLELYKHTPTEFRDKVRSVKTGTAKNKTPGTISNSTASAIINLEKMAQITSTQKKALFKKASQDPTVTASKVRAIAKTGTSGMDVTKAVKNFKTIQVTLKMTNNQAKKLGKNPQQKVRDMVSEYYGIKLI